MDGEGGPGGSPAPALELQDWGVEFGERVILQGIHLVLPAGGIDVLMGPVKTGKSTLMRSLAGLNDGNRLFRATGIARVQGLPWASAPRPRMVQQRADVLNLSVQDALVSGVRSSTERSASAWGAFARSRLDEHGLQALHARLHEPLLDLPVHLQRCVGILAQALAAPGCLFIDEPTYGLAPQEASAMVRWLRALGERTRLLVTLHHQGQARALGDRIVLLGGGQVIAHQPTEDFFLRPANRWVAHFLQSGSLPLPAPQARRESRGELGMAADGSAPAPAPVASPGAGSPAPATSGERAAPATASPRRPARLPAPSADSVEEASMVGRALLSERRGPSGFHWIVPGRLAGCPEPGISAPAAYDLDLLRRVGITCLVTLTEHDLDAELLRDFGLKNIHLPIFDREAPTLGQAYMLLKRMQDLLSRGEVLAVHCRAGIGRTGTILAAWLIREGGLSAATAIERLRNIHRAFVQTEAQERFLERLERDLLSRID